MNPHARHEWVSCSNKRWFLKHYDTLLYHQFLQKYGLSEVLARLLSGRSFNPSLVKEYLNPKLKDWLPHPFSLKNMEKGVDRLYKAFHGREKITVFGDYDVDGSTSTALLINFFKMLGHSIDFYIPHRLTEGYGPTPQAFEKIFLSGTTLLITVDCGTLAYDALSYAQEKKLDILTIDHHGADIDPPVAPNFLINPYQQGDTSGLTYLSAVGLTFMVLVGFVQRLKEDKHPIIPDLRELLDLVALGTVCDVVPLVNLNRAFVLQGLEVLKKRPNLGLQALMEVSAISGPADSYHLGFILGPRINAGGRIEHADLGVQLLTTNDPEQARLLAEKLSDLNQERQQMEEKILLEAMNQVEHNKLHHHPIICVRSDEWHPGVIGIVASRLKEKFEKPVCVASFMTGEGKGSGRSVKGVHLGHLIKDAYQKGFLLKGGGHAMAAGFTLNAHQWDNFTACLYASIPKNYSSVSESFVDLILDIGGVTIETIQVIDLLGPFGADNPKPKIMIPNIYVDFIQLRGQKHLACTLKGEDGSSLKGMAFKAHGTVLGDRLYKHKNIPCHLIGTLKIDYWQGRRIETFIIEDCI